MFIKLINYQPFLLMLARTYSNASGGGKNLIQIAEANIMGTPTTASTV